MADNNSQNTQSNSNNNKRRNNYRNKNRNRNKNFSAKPQQADANSSGQNNSKPAQQASSNNDNKDRKNRSRNRRPKTLTPARIIQKYENLLEQHLIARKKYFEIFGRVNDKQLEKAEQNFNKTLKALYEYESTLDKDWQKDILNEKVNQYPEDREFSTTHNLGTTGDEISFDESFEDPHLLPTQKATVWANDTEESEGTMDDYKMYKGQ